MISPIPNTWLWAGAAAAIASGYILAGVQTTHLHKAELRTAQLQAEWDAERVKLLTAAVTATAAARDTETRWQTQQKEALNVAQKATDAARADAAAALDAVGRLRQRASITARGCAATSSAGAASPSAPASSPADLLADVSGRLAEAGRQLAEYSDRAVIAGAACEAAWPRRITSPQAP